MESVTNLDIIDDIETCEQINNQDKLRKQYGEVAKQLGVYAQSLKAANKTIVKQKLKEYCKKLGYCTCDLE